MSERCNQYDYVYDSADPYVYKGTTVLVNKFGILNTDVLSRVERKITGVEAARLAENPIDGDFDLMHLQAIHKKLFGEIYEWAGCIREHGFISKGNSLFCAAEHIVPYSTSLFANLHREKLLQELDRDTFASRMAYYLAEINALHPFREGNGRAQRVFANQLARKAGWNLNLLNVTADELCKAYIASMNDTHDLEVLLKATVKPL